METRTITQAKIYRLILNPMCGNTENADIVAISYDKNKLIDWYESEFEDKPYYSIANNYFSCKGDFPANVIEGQRFYKVFKRGGILEWYNPCESFEQNRHGHGIDEMWAMQESINQYEGKLVE